MAPTSTTPQTAARRPRASAPAAAPPNTAGCAAVPSACGYPDATSTGVPAGTRLRTVPGQVSSGPGWHYDTRGWVEVNGDGATLTGLCIPYTVDISANNVTVDKVKVITGGDFGISLRHTSGVTIQNSTIGGSNSTTGRVDTAIKDVYGDTTGTTIENNNIFSFRTGIVLSAGLIEGNYLHSPGFQAGDHTNGIYNDGGAGALTINHNTVFNPKNQTDAITLEAASPGEAVANKTITNNLLAGGGYVIYGGASLGNPTSNIVIKNNVFAQQYHPKSGVYGPAAYYDYTGPGNTWTGNIWDTTGQTVPCP